MDTKVFIMPEKDDYVLIVDELNNCKAYLLKRYEGGLNLISPEYVYIGEQNNQKIDKKVLDDSHRSIEVYNPNKEKFTNCNECTHDGDTAEICKQRGCTHAFSYLRECFEPKDCHPYFHKVNHSLCCENNI